MKLVRGNGFADHLDLQINTKAGKTRDVLASAETIHLNGEACLLSMMIDITERKRVEKALRELNDDLEGRVAQRTSELTAAMRQLTRLSQMQD